MGFYHLHGVSPLLAQSSAELGQESEPAVWSVSIKHVLTIGYHGSQVPSLLLEYGFGGPSVRYPISA